MSISLNPTKPGARMNELRIYPWYERIESGGELDQGDILFNCPIVQIDELAQWPLGSGVIPLSSQEGDMIIMTQTCDFANGKTRNVIVCRHSSVTELGFGKARQKEIIRGLRPREAMLEASDGAFPMERRVIDLGEIYSLLIAFVRLLAATQTPRLRLLPPYREHISQAFARFFMRVGLPQDIRLD